MAEVEGEGYGWFAVVRFFGGKKRSTFNAKQCWVAENRLVFLQSERVCMKLIFVLKKFKNLPCPIEVNSL